MARIKAAPNVLAMLDTIAFTEGTDNGHQVTRDDGYDVLVGGNLFVGYAHHPNVKVRLNDRLTSTAAGRYQILKRMWDAYHFPNFEPEQQDEYAIRQFVEQSAFTLLLMGKFDEAVHKLNNIWASLPGSPYGQPTVPLDKCREVYVSKGGKLCQAQ